MKYLVPEELMKMDATSQTYVYRKKEIMKATCAPSTAQEFAEKMKSYVKDTRKQWDAACLPFATQEE